MPPSPHIQLLFLSSPEDMLIDFREGEGGGERTKHLLLASCRCPDWDCNSNPGMFLGGKWNLQPFNLQDDNPAMEPHQPGSPHITFDYSNTTTVIPWHLQGISYRTPADNQNPWIFKSLI